MKYEPPDLVLHRYKKKLIAFFQLYEARATGPKIVVEVYAVSPEKVETKLAVPHYPTVGV